MSGYTVEQADQMRSLFDAAAEASPINQVRSEMAARAREWAVAAELLAHVGEGFVIELAGAVVRHMRVVREDSFHGDLDDFPVERVIHRDGSCTLHLVVNGGAVYQNLHSAASPVVVKQ